MSTASMPLPGALRWRALHPLVDENGTCSLIYDLERAAVLEVPEELRLHAAAALETGDPDDELLSWLVGEDLITMEGWAGWCPDADLAVGAIPAWPQGMLFRQEGEMRVRLEALPEEAAVQALEVAFRQGLGAPRVRLHLDWSGRFPRPGLLQRIVLEARRLAAEGGQTVSFDLALQAVELTPAVAASLASLPVHVRLGCGVFQGGGAPLARFAERALPLVLAEELAERVTFCFELAAGVRLRDLWGWARGAGVKHLDADFAAAAESGEGAASESGLRELHADLLDLVQDVSLALDSCSTPVDFRPVTRIVRRLLESEPLSRFREARHGWPVGDVGMIGACGAPGATREWLEAGAAEGGGDEPASGCAGCWARYVCHQSAILGAHAAAARGEVSCAIWQAQAEAALRLYHRLAQADPLQVLRVFGDSSELPDDLPAGGRQLWLPKEPF